VETLKIEAHLIGYEGSLYDELIEVDLLVRLRDIKKFDSPHELVTQMKSDVSVARKTFDQQQQPDLRSEI
jgi:riboflavin kinase/FMN adenylyltransferase